MLVTDGFTGAGRITLAAASVAAAMLAAGAQAQAPPPVSEPAPSAIRLDQLGFEAGGPKRAVVVSQARAPLAWTVNDAQGRVVAHGVAEPRGRDASSGQRLQVVDLSALHTPGRGYVLRVGGEASRPFSLSRHPFRQLKLDALHYFYETRSGVPIERRFVSDPGPGAARRAPARRRRLLLGPRRPGRGLAGLHHQAERHGRMVRRGRPGQVRRQRRRGGVDAAERL